MHDILAYVWIVAGVVASFFLPALIAAAKRVWPSSGVEASSAGAVWKAMKPYLVVCALGAIAALVLLAVYRSAHPHGTIAWYTAFLAGFGWQAALEKLVRDSHA